MRKLLSVLVMLFAISLTGCADQQYAQYPNRQVQQYVIIQQPTIYSVQCNRYFYTYGEKNACENAANTRYVEQMRQVQQESYRREHDKNVRENEAKRYGAER